MVLPGCGLFGPDAEANRDHHGPRDVEQYIERLEDTGRDEHQQPDQVVQALQLAPDAAVADVGCGPGYFTLRLAKAVPRGMVFAVDVEPRQLDRLNEHLTTAGIDNVVPVLAPHDDPRLPPASVDLVLIVNTYHHFDNRSSYLAKLRAALRPAGRLVNIDFFKKEMEFGPPVAHKIARDDSVSEFEAAGFQLIEEPTILEHQYFLIFTPGTG